MAVVEGAVVVTPELGGVAIGLGAVAVGPGVGRPPAVQAAAVSAPSSVAVTTLRFSGHLLLEVAEPGHYGTPAPGTPGRHECG